MGTQAEIDLAARQRATWALGDYAGLAGDIIGDLGRTLVAACGVRPAERVLDVAAGAGNAALPAARIGATVVASDITPELLEVGRRRAEAEGLQLTWQEADAATLPWPDGTFDVVLSCVGVMFVPHHRGAADELVRVARPGGRIGLLSWTPTGFIGRVFATMGPYAPAPPAGALPPPLWGDEDHVRELLGDRVEDLVARRGSVRISRYATGAEFRDDFKARYGPTVALYRALAGEPERAEALDRELAALADGHRNAGGDMDWEYLLVTARRAGSGAGG